MNEWIGLFLAEMLLIVGAVLLGIFLSDVFSGKTLINGVPLLFGTMFVFISVFLKLVYGENLGQQRRYF